MTSAKTSCSVCGEELEAHLEAWCNACGLPYHLNQRTDLPGKDCGQVWINEEFLALEFACNTCLNPPKPELDGALDDVLDIQEASSAVGVSERDLQMAADDGRVRHRKTASGVYLFQRGDVIEFAQGRK
ncbi:MAG: hypothetical protein LC118_06825 [Dehalococcoidia bacterium]|nr:hypothetical protein [Dehalococcoidia bacterium]